MKRIIILLMPLLVFAFSCESGNEPGSEIKDPRQFIWSADTIYYQDSYQTMIRSTWANNENDIYAVGHTDVNEGAFWHYNGEQWEMIRIFDYIERGTINFVKIFGLSESQIWIAGDRGNFGEEIPVVWQYNGHSIFETRLDALGGLSSIHGTSRDNIWACGDSGLVAHYDGLQWTIDKIPQNNLNLKTLYLFDIVSDQNTAYILSAGLDNSSERTKNYFIKGNINNWTIIDSSTVEPYGHISKWGYRHLYMSKWNTIYSHTHGLFKFTNMGWQRITDFFDHTPTRDLSGTEENNMIIVGDYSKAYHWNGSDVYQFTELENDNISSYNCVEIFNDQAFIFGHTISFPQKTIVYHGE